MKGFYDIFFKAKFGILGKTHNPHREDIRFDKSL